MASIEELRSARIAKIEKLKKAGMDPYPATLERTYSISEIKNSFAAIASSSNNKPISIVGRVMVIRGQGAILFIVLQDGKDRLQAVLKKDILPANVFNLFVDTVDNGDFVGVTGSLFITDRGEQSILIKNWRMATKALLPLPDKWGGLQDVEERFRKRYLDFLTTVDLQELFVKKARFWEVTRVFMKSHGFLEVETPTLEVTTGGAEAHPFRTHHKDFDIDVFLRISIGELWQKRLMAAGFEKTFEIGRAYRNEGTSSEHLQEFTNMEFYWAYANYKNGMKLTQELFQTIAKEVFNSMTFSTGGYTFDLSGDWPAIEYQKEILKQTGIDVLKSSEKDMKSKLDELKVKYDGENRERLMDTLWKYCRKNITGPVFLVHHPKLVSPLSKSCPDNPELTERFQIIIAGSEIGNGFSELNDPIDQRARFEFQQKLIDKGDTEAMQPEWEFVEMLEHGMPPTCGFGFGERLFAFMVDKPIRETQLFPLMKPKD